MQATKPEVQSDKGAQPIMNNIRRRTSRAILVPFALFVIVLGGALPASAAPLDSGSPDAPTYFIIGPLSLRW
jgi:hypothetical protein